MATRRSSPCSSDEGGFPDPSAVRFTGPAGSGYTNTPADSEMNGTNPDGTKARYVSSPRAGIVTEPGGVWSVLFKGTSRSFVVPRVYFDARLVVLNPTVTIDGGVLNRVDWVYWDRLTGDVIPTAPSFIRNVQVVLSLNNDFVEIESPLLDRSAISYTVPSQPSFGDARELSLDSVNTTSCGFVSVVNDGALGPFPSPVCIPRTGTTQFDDDPTLIDIFSIRQDLVGPALPVGTAFQFTVTPIAPRSPQTVVTTLKNPEANTATDYTFIPNANTPSLRPSGTDLPDARLGQNMTVSWSLPSFAIQEQFFSPIVSIEDGAFCQGNQQNLTPGTTSTTFKFPTTCFGQAPVQAQFCIFFKGDNGESSTGCWFFGEPG